MDFDSSHVRRVWLVAVCMTELIVVCNLIATWPAPVPQRFAEASDVFLYTMPAYGYALSLLSMGTALLGGFFYLIWKTWMRHRFDAWWGRVKTTLTLSAAVVTGIAAVPFQWIDLASYQGLTDNGYIGRTYWSATLHHQEWSRLHAVTLQCGGGNSRDPKLSLQFESGHILRNVLVMRPVNMSKAEALGRVDHGRKQANIPLSWQNTDDGRRFVANDNARINECVTRLLRYFSPDVGAEIRQSLSIAF